MEKESIAENVDEQKTIEDEATAEGEVAIDEALNEQEESKVDDTEREALADDELGEEEEAEDDDEDKFSLLGEEDTELECEMYREYLCLLKDIRAQNRLIADLKQQKTELCQQSEEGCCDSENIKNIKCCIRAETCKLQCLLNRAMFLQNFGSKRRYEYVPVETDMDESSSYCDSTD